MANKITILGCGETGFWAALLGNAKDYEVCILDSGKIAAAKRHVLQDLAISYHENFEISTAKDALIKSICESLFVIKSPGIPGDSDIIKFISKHGIDIFSDLDFAYKFISVPIIGVTGTNGKSTTTALLGHVLEYSCKVAVCGNIGISICKKVLEGDYDMYVVEISSYQLEDIKIFRCNIAVITNISPDHLDRYNYDFARYVAAKCRILELVESYTYSDGKKLPGSIIYPRGNAFLQPKLDTAKISCKKYPITTEGATLCINNPALRGSFNLANALMVYKVVEILGLPQADDALETFKGLEHRLEYVATLDGVSFYNDSKATNVGAVHAALQSFISPENMPPSAGGLASGGTSRKPNIIWIAGGQDKGNDYATLAKIVEENVKHLICLGVDNANLKQYFAEKIILETQQISQAVCKALEVSCPGDTVLFSPACASFDLFKNFEERGRLFKACVAKLQ